jgi:hypothetical protein
VKVVWKDLSDRTPDSVAEPNQVRRCIVTARSLICGTVTEGYVRILNCDDSAHRLRAGEVIGTVEPAAVAVEGQPQSRPCFSARGSDFTESVPR